MISVGFPARSSDSGVTILQCGGEIIAGGPELVQFQNILSAAIKPNGRLLLNFSGISRIDAAGLRIMCEAQKAAGLNDCEVKLCSLKETVRETFALGKVGFRFVFHADEKEALRSFNPPEPPALPLPLPQCD